MPHSPGPIPSRSWGPATTPTCTTGCGQTVSRASTAGPPTSTPAPAPPSATSTPRRRAPPRSPPTRPRSPVPADTKTLSGTCAARRPVADFTRRPPAAERARLRAEQRDVVAGLLSQYNPEAVVCVGVPFGHTRPQWIVPHGGAITVDGAARRVTGDYS